MFWLPERAFHHLLRSRCGALSEQLLRPLSTERSNALFATARGEARLKVQQGQSHRKAYKVVVQMAGPRIRGA
eukprot:1690020-Lingulodinium_polyedra.AAC.1